MHGFCCPVKCPSPPTRIGKRADDTSLTVPDLTTEDMGGVAVAQDGARVMLT